MLIRYQLYDLQVFSSDSVGFTHSFHSLDSIPLMQKTFCILIEFNLSIFSFVALLLVSCLKKSLPATGHEFSPVFLPKNFMVPEVLSGEGPTFLCMAYSRHLSLVCELYVTQGSCVPCHQTCPAMNSKPSRTTLFSCPLLQGRGLCTAAGHMSSVPSPEKWVLTATRRTRQIQKWL